MKTHLVPGLLALALLTGSGSGQGAGERASATQESSGVLDAAARKKKEQITEDSPEFCRARDLLYAQDFRGAEQAFRAIVDENGEDGRALFYLGYSLHALKRYEDALAMHIRASRFEKYGPAALYNAGCANALLGRPDEAFRWIERAFEAGFDNRELVGRDPDLDSLRSDPRLATYLPRETSCDPFEGPFRILHTFHGEAPGDQFGWGGRNAGDCDGDGLSDILISAPYQSAEGTNAGTVYLFSGKSGELIFARSGGVNENLGLSLGAAGDLDGDGRADVLAGAPGGDRSDAGERIGSVYAFSGADGSTLLELRSDEPEDAFGWEVTGVGDLNGDGHDDVAVGAPMSDRPGALPEDAPLPDAGAVNVYSGRDGELLLTLRGERKGDELGSAVAGVVTGGRRLLAVGACNAGPGRHGRVTVYEVTNLIARPHFTIEADERGENLGRMFVSFVGDVDGDGTQDVYASDWEHNERGRATGRVYVHSGRTGERLWTFTGEHAGDRFGVGSGRAGDVDGDGHDDVIVGAWRNSEGAPSGGKCYVFSGATGELLRQFVSTSSGDAFGFDAAGLGDLDGDGGVDFLVTSAWSHARGKRAGRAFVLAGPVCEPVVATRAQVETPAADERDE